MKKLLVINSDKCTGCRLCERVCSVQHEGVSNPARSRIHVIKWEGEGFYLPMVCQQCEEAVCVAVCPKGATKKRPDRPGVTIDYDLCIGCHMCVAACPFGGTSLDPVAEKVIKCDLCGGEPMCVSFCDAEAIEYLDTDKAVLRKKRRAGEKLSELMRKFA
ncbi:MAG: 4Fe-4S dicluster domain-containing protein [Pseudomonadota bacterium]